jgi:hypothetical protein
MYLSRGLGSYANARSTLRAITHAPLTTGITNGLTILSFQAVRQFS